MFVVFVLSLLLCCTMQRPRRRVIFLTFYDLDNLGLDNARPVRQFAPSSSSSQVVTVEAVSLVPRQAVHAPLLEDHCVGLGAAVVPEPEKAAPGHHRFNGTAKCVPRYGRNGIIPAILGY